MYKIEYDYYTGDSFGTEDRTSTLEFEWELVDKANEALKRIEEHWRWYDENCRHHYYSREDVVTYPEPAWHKGLYESIIKLELDNGEEVEFWAPWCGYFEGLYGAEIKQSLPGFGSRVQ